MNPLDPESFLLTLQFDRSIFSPVIYLIQYMAHSRYLINVWSGPGVNDPPSNAGDMSLTPGWGRFHMLWGHKAMLVGAHIC